MYQVEDKPETIHLYVVREGPARPSFAPIVLSLFTLSLLIVLGIALPYRQPVTRLAIRVPAVPLGIRSFSASVTIVPTGIRTYPATTARSTLTITNGSIIAQVIPQGFVIQNVVTERAVYVPAGSASGYGYATVPAHALGIGSQGNLPALAIDAVIGSSVYIRNLNAFTGGRDSYTIKVITAHDKDIALLQARRILLIRSSGFHYPCTETFTGALLVTWRCQFVSYHLPPSLHVAAVHFAGMNFILTVWYVAHPQRMWVK